MNKSGAGMCKTLVASYLHNQRNQRRVHGALRYRYFVEACDSLDGNGKCATVDPEGRSKPDSEAFRVQSSALGED